MKFKKFSTIMLGILVLVVVFGSVVRLACADSEQVVEIDIIELEETPEIIFTDPEPPGPRPPKEGVEPVEWFWDGEALSINTSLEIQSLAETVKNGDLILHCNYIAKRFEKVKFIYDDRTGEGIEFDAETICDQL